MDAFIMDFNGVDLVLKWPLSNLPAVALAEVGQLSYGRLHLGRFYNNI
jgi:hypothetical protein